MSFSMVSPQSLIEKFKYSELRRISSNKTPYRAFSRQASRLILNIIVLQGLLRVNSKTENMDKVDKLKIINYRF